MRHYKIASCLYTGWQAVDGAQEYVYWFLVGSIEPAGGFLIGRWLVGKPGLLPDDFRVCMF